MAIPPATAPASASATSHKRTASVALSDSDIVNLNIASTSTMRTSTAVDAHKRKRRRRKLSVTKDVPGPARILQKVERSPSNSSMGSLKGKERADALEGDQSHAYGITSDADANCELASLREKVEQQNGLLEAHNEFLTALAQSLTCQICLDPMHKPYALAPCGHTACYGCLLAWFRAPPQHIAQPPPEHLAHNFDRDDPNLLARDAPMLLRKEKTCPHCRAVVREAPVEAWGVKDIVAHLFASKGGMAKDLYPGHDKPSETHEGGADTWKGVFRRDRTPGGRAAQNANRNDDVEANEDDDHGGDRGFYDDEDGVYRCTVCYHEIWDGICSSCGRLYPGHQDHAEDEGEDGGLWMDAQGFDEGWMNAHDVFDGPDADVIDLDELVGVFARDAGYEDEDGYESSFIDDEDGGARIEEYHSAEEDGHYDSEDEDEREDAGEDADGERRAGRSSPRIARVGDPAHATVDLTDSDSDAQGVIANYLRARGPRTQNNPVVEDIDSDIDYARPVRQAAPRANRTIVLDSDSEREDDERSDLNVEGDVSFYSRSISDRGSLSGDDSDHFSHHRELYGSGSGSSHYNDAFSDEEDGINWSD